MNYNKIKYFCEQKKISIKELAFKIDMTDAGLYKAINNQSLRIDDLEKIASALNVSISSFFDDVDILIDENNNLKKGILLQNYGNINHNMKDYEKEIDYLKQQIESLKEQIKLKDEIITLLRQIKE